MHYEIMGGTSIWNAQTLSASCDLDLWPRDVALHTTHCLVVMIISAKYFFKSHHAWWNYGLDKILECTNLRADCDLDLDLETWFLHATHCLVLMIICAKYFFKSHHAWWSYDSDTILESKNFKCPLWPWPLTQWYGSYMGHIVWLAMIICAK